MEIYRGILIRESFHDAKFPDGAVPHITETYSYNLDGVIPVTIAKLTIPSDLVQEVAWEVSKQLLPSKYYAHFVSEQDLMVSFPNAVVRVLRDELQTSENARKVGHLFDIPDYQMKFELLFDQDHPKVYGAESVDVCKRPAVAITGGTQGIGFAVANSMASKGYNLFLGYHQDEIAATSAKNIINERNPECVIELFQHNNNLLEDAKKFFLTAVKTFSTLTSFIHAAGMSSDDWDELTQGCESFVPVLVCPELFVEYFNQQGHGHIILVSSTAALRPFPKGRFYAAAKAAMEGYVRAVAVQSLPSVFINCVAPGIIIDEKKHGKDSIHTIYKGTRKTQADDIASIIVWLATENRAMTGQALVLDNGLTVGLSFSN